MEEDSAPTREELRAAFVMLEELMDMAPTDEDRALLHVIDQCVASVARAQGMTILGVEV